jgi:hypothetical protein
MPGTETISDLIANAMKLVFQSYGSVVGIETTLWTERPRNRGLFPARSERFMCSPKYSDRIWGPNNFSIQWVQGALSRAICGAYYSSNIFQC